MSTAEKRTQHNSSPSQMAATRVPNSPALQSEAIRCSRAWPKSRAKKPKTAPAAAARTQSQARVTRPGAVNPR
jgi:hypothetical protein